MAADGEDGRSDRSLLSVRQVAKLLGVCPATVYALCEQRKLPHFRVLNAIRIDPKAVKRFLARVAAVKLKGTSPMTRPDRNREACRSIAPERIRATPAVEDEIDSRAHGRA